MFCGRRCSQLGTKITSWGSLQCCQPYVTITRREWTDEHEYEYECADGRRLVTRSQTLWNLAITNRNSISKMNLEMMLNLNTLNSEHVSRQLYPIVTDNSICCSYHYPITCNYTLPWHYTWGGWEPRREENMVAKTKVPGCTTGEECRIYWYGRQHRGPRWVFRRNITGIAMSPHKQLLLDLLLTRSINIFQGFDVLSHFIAGNVQCFVQIDVGLGCARKCTILDYTCYQLL